MANDTTLDKVVIEFDGKVKNFDASIDTLIEEIKGLREQLKGMGQDAKDAGDDLEESTEDVDKMSKSAKSLSLSLSGAKKTFALFGLLTKKITGWTEKSTQAIGVQTRFNSVFNTTAKELEEAQGWANEYSENLYLDKVEVMDAASNFKLLAGNIGLTNDQANKMSKNLTMLSYDLMKVKTESDASMAQTAIASAMGGEAEAMKRYGVMLNQATLQQTLYSLGIDRTVASLNGAEKAQLTYYHIMTTTAGQHGYYAKTLMSPANAFNMIRTQIELLTREIGNVFIPLLMALTPIIVNITQILRALAEALANAFGFKIAFDDYTTGFGNISGGLDGIGESADATGAKIKNMTRDFDKLHVVNFDKGNGSGGGIGSGLGGSSGFNLIDQANYNRVLAETKDQLIDVEKVVGFIKDHWLEIAGAIGGLSLFKFIGSILGANSKLGITKSLLGAIGFAATGIALTMEIKLIPELVENGFFNEDNSFDAEAYGKSLGISGLGGLGVAGIAKFFGATNPIVAIAGLTAAAGVHSFNSGIAIGNEIKEIQKNLEVLEDIQDKVEEQEERIAKQRQSNTVAKFLNQFGEDKYSNIWNSLVSKIEENGTLNFFDMMEAKSWQKEIDMLEAKMKFQEGKKNIAQFVRFTSQNFNTMKQENGQKIEGLKAKFAEFVGNGKRYINDLKDKMTSEFDKMKNNTSNTVESMSKSIMTSLGLVEQEGGSKIESLVNKITGNIQGINTKTKSQFEEFKNRITSGFEKMKQDATTDMNELNSSTINIFDKLKNDSNGKLSGFVGNTINKFKELTTGTKKEIANLETNTTDKFTNLGSKISNAFTNARTNASSEIEKIKNLTKFEWSLPSLKVPHFQVTKAISNIGSILGEIVMPEIKVSFFETGGFPDTGSLFVANEREPELIGSWGNKSMVANSTQIIKGIESASYNGMKRALTEVPMSNETNVYVGNKQLTDVVTKQQRRNNNKYGR